MSSKIHLLQVAIALSVLLVAALIGWGVSSFPAETGYAGVGPRFYPGIIASLLALVGALLMWQATRGGYPGLASDDAPPRDWVGAAWVATGLLLHAALITHVGFVLSATLLFVAVARGFGSIRPLRDALAGALLAWPVFTLFTRVLDVSLPALLKPWI